MAALLLLWCGAALAAPQPQSSTPPPPPIQPTVDNMTMYGSGCPIGSGGMVREMRNNTPVFLFPDWSLSLASDAGANGSGGGSVSKFCTEEISLGNAPPGFQVRLSTVSVSGYADLDKGSVIGIGVETKLGAVDGGVRIKSIAFPLPILLYYYHLISLPSLLLLEGL